MAAPDPFPDLLKAVNDASGKAFALWLTFLSVWLIQRSTSGTTTHVQLLLETPVKLPLLNVDLPLFAFYEFAPIFSSDPSLCADAALSALSLATSV